MQAFDFAPLPRASLVAGVVTLLACGWLTLAMGAILTDRHSEHTVASARQAAPAQVAQVVPDARFTIVVEERRSAAL